MATTVHSVSFGTGEFRSATYCGPVAELYYLGIELGSSDINRTRLGRDYVQWVLDAAEVNKMLMWTPLSSRNRHGI